tara:strand:- start:398 stop:679 length:282 start_codon:yes stop_codon:yes gene_type:complete
MGLCAYCEKEQRETFFGSYCSGCRQLKNLCNVYGYDRILGILKEVCIRNEDQLENKILKKKAEIDAKDEDLNPKIIDEKSEYYLRRPKDKNKN